METKFSKFNSSNQDLAYSLQYFLCFGRFLCVIPFNGLLKAKSEQLKFKLKSISALPSILIAICLGFNTIIGLIGFFKNNNNGVNEVAWSAHLWIFYGSGFFIYTYFLLYSENFIELLQKWKRIKMHFPVTDQTLRRDVTLIAIIIFTSIASENTTWHLRHFIQRKEINSNSLLQGMDNLTNNNDSGIDDAIIQHSSLKKFKYEFGSLESFYNRSEPEWATVFPYHPLISVYVLITSKWALFSWNFFDVMLIVLSRALYKKYKLFNEVAHKVLFDCGYLKDSNKWRELMDDHLTLSNLLSEFENFLSPIVFISYAANIYDVSIHMSWGLSPKWNSSTIGTIYSVWAFIHLTVRLFWVSWAAAEINSNALDFAQILKKCPTELYSYEIKKFETQLFHANIGLHGFGCFTVTKSFMLRLLGVIFTVEIVLLQSYACLKHEHH